MTLVPGYLEHRLAFDIDISLFAGEDRRVSEFRVRVETDDASVRKGERGSLPRFRGHGDHLGGQIPYLVLLYDEASGKEEDQGDHGSGGP